MKATKIIAITIDNASVKVRGKGASDDINDYDTIFWAGVIPLKTITLTEKPDSKLKTTIKTPISVSNYIKKHS